MIFRLKRGFLWDIRYAVWAVNSAGECYLHTVEVTGSIPVPPTMKIKGLRNIPEALFLPERAAPSGESGGIVKNKRQDGLK